MATFNTAHHESGGVILFSGELILLFCDNVNLTLPQTNQNETGRLYLTTHRMVFTNKSMKGSLKSFSAPFFSMHDLSLEQPIFGANYIKGKVNDANNSNAITFKLKFNSGGAIEYGQALQSAARVTRSMAAQTAFQPPPPYTASASQYYQAPPNVYQPAYNVGFVLPTDVFNQAPPAGFVYTSEAPPPYPGLSPQQPPPQHQQHAGGYPPGSNGYPPASANSYPPAPANSYPPASANSYPPASGYPPAANYPPTGGPAGYPPSSEAGYPPTSTYPAPSGYQSNQIGFAPAIAPYPPTSQLGFASAGPGYPGGGAPGGYPPSQPPQYPAANGASAYPGYPGQNYPSLNNEFPQASAPSAPFGTPEKRPF